MAVEMPSERASATEATSQNAAEIDEKSIHHSLELPNQTSEPENVSTVAGNGYPVGSRLGGIIAALCLAVFCVGLDNAIISTAIPRITDEFHALQDIGWYGSAYLLTISAFQLFYGKLYASFNVKTVFLVALLIFEVGSALCGASPSSSALIVGRAIAGFGAAGLFSGSFVIIAHSCPVYKRPAYTGIVGGTYGLGSVLGPLIGGAFTFKVTWRWCFYINLPLGGISAIIIILLLKSKNSSAQNGGKSGLLEVIWYLDPIGTILFVPSIICLLLALKWGGTTYNWDDGRIIALFVVFGILFVTFMGVQYWMGDKATVPLHIASQRTIAASSVFAIFMGGGFIIMTYFLPVWFQAIKGVDPWESGVRLIPLVLSMTLGIALSGGLTTKFGYYMPFVYANVVLTSIGAGLLTTLAPNSDPGKWIGYQIIFGLGCGFAIQVPQIAAPIVLPLQDVAQGVSITFFAQLFGGALFASISDNVLNNKLVKYIGALDIPAEDPKSVVQLGATQLRTGVPPAFVQQTVSAYNHALVDTFQIALIIACVSVLGAVGMEWKNVHSSGAGNGAQEGANTQVPKET
ncbi:Efflux pump [Lachnellula hyalina]|uniref:Efflux pump n=1 Tax=Lachnellula hyalina TaxID=1316788 RepID=A0A8H8U217_9HELO|nr:Efflux pump [Lachnellula hyalina]TVY30659.1 Efflux pump [Lachnellula hyalina]